MFNAYQYLCQRVQSQVQSQVHCKIQLNRLYFLNSYKLKFFNNYIITKYSYMRDWRTLVLQVKLKTHNNPTLINDYTSMGKIMLLIKYNYNYIHYCNII